MTVATVSQKEVSGLPKVETNGLPGELKIAQESIHLPEIQEMLKKLSEYNLGIFMPHMHDEATGDFQVLPRNLMQVESGLEVTFRSTEDINSQMNNFLPIGWVWDKDSPTPSAVCHTVCEKRGTDTNHYSVHEKNAVLSK